MRESQKAAALTLAAAMVFSLAGCGRNAGNQTGKSSGAAAGSGKTRQGSLEAGSGQVTIKIGHVEAEDRSTHQALVKIF